VHDRVVRVEWGACGVAQCWVVTGSMTGEEDWNCALPSDSGGYARDLCKLHLICSTCLEYGM